MALKPEEQSHRLFLDPLPLTIQNVTQTLAPVGIMLEMNGFKAYVPRSNELEATF